MRKNYILSILSITLFLDVLGGSMLLPLIPSLFTDPNSPSFMLSGYSNNSLYIIAGFVTAIFSIMQFLIAPIFGDFSDSYGRKKFLLLGVGILAIANILFGFAIAVGSLILLVISRIIAGIAGANLSTAQAIVADITAPENRIRNFGLIGASLSLGLIVGPLLSGLISNITNNSALPFLIVGILGIFNLFFIYLMLPETLNNGGQIVKLSFLKSFHNVQLAYRDFDLRSLYFGIFFQRMGFVLFTSFLAIFLVLQFSFSETQTGIFFSVIGLWMVLGQLILVKIVSHKFSEKKILIGSLPVLAAIIFFHPFITNVVMIFFTIPFVAFSVALINSGFPALISKMASDDKQGVALGIHGSLHALTQGFAPIIAGMIVALFGINSIFILGCVLILVSWLIITYNKTIE